MWLTLDVKPGVVGRWARIELLVSDDRLPIEERHYDRKGRLARTMRFDEVRVLALTCTFSDAVSVLGSVYLPYERAPAGGVLHSEYGATPLSGVLQLRVYF